MKTMGLTNPGLLQDLANEGQRTCFVLHSIAVMVPRGTFCSLPCVYSPQEMSQTNSRTI
jgi:hypothetical protein